MNCHQILSGACNAGDRCFATGSVEGVPFTAYAAGCNIVILASTFERVQIIPGAVHNYVRISCVDCSTDTGKIAAAYENRICIFEPTPLIYSSSAHQLDYRWIQTANWITGSRVSSLSWNLEGNRLLTGGEILQLWQQTEYDIDRDTDSGSIPAESVVFEIGECETPMKVEPAPAPPDERENENDEDKGVSKKTSNSFYDDESSGWSSIWVCQTATPIYYIAFSPDGTLFATAGRDDRLVKIWFENKQLLFPPKTLEYASQTDKKSSSNVVDYGFVYIAHPRAITYLSWRKTSKYMPKGSVSNMLITACRDNICRMWVETVLPDDGLVNMSHFDPLAAHNPRFRTHRHKHRFMQRLKHMKTCFHLRRHAKDSAELGDNCSLSSNTIPTLPSSYSVHDFHSYGFHGTGIIPGLHFHLATSINAETDIPLVPSMPAGESDSEPNFVLHWLNNKEMHFSIQAEEILNELTKKVVEREDMFGFNDSTYSLNNANDHFELNPCEDAFETSEKKKNDVFTIEENEPSLLPNNEPCNLSASASSNATLSNATSLNSIPNEGNQNGSTSSHGHMTDLLDARIECLLRDWHHSPDLVFAVHPVDGSFLIWMVEWLDEYHPGSFRQASVSFSTRIPYAFPLGDATTMSTNVCLYHTSGSQLQITFREAVRSAAASVSLSGYNTDNSTGDDHNLTKVDEEEERSNYAGEDNHDVGSAVSSALGTERDTSLADIVSAPPAPALSMVTKHTNGTLNLWQLTFADKTKFTQVLSIGYASRASGHRFRVNDITCHPVLPLLLTTSHHNLPEGTLNSPVSIHPPMIPAEPSGFCSELILWRVDPVGPLSKSGGVSELARINSPHLSAFSNVAWIPTLLPSTTLGNLSNSPSACFVASDGESLTIYQAVIDARTLLSELAMSERNCSYLPEEIAGSVSGASESSAEDAKMEKQLDACVRLVSQQSTARPGCIIQLDPIADATHDWQNTQFLHVYQEQLITGERSSCGATSLEFSVTDAYSANDAGLGITEAQCNAIVDLHRDKTFEEPFYIVLLERTIQNTIIHMWRLILASPPPSDELSGSMMYFPDCQLVQDDDDAENMAAAASVAPGGIATQSDTLQFSSVPRLIISTTKVCTQELPLPDGVDVIHASPAGGHLSSASIYPACFAPYLLVTACSDSTLRFWKCKTTKSNRADKNDRKNHRVTYEWEEWRMLRQDESSMIEISGQPLNISAAYSGRIACAYKYGKSFTRPSKKDPDSRYVNLCVVIYECESTGGSEWILEDTIYLKNIHLPTFQLDPIVDLSYANSQTFLSRKQKLQSSFIKAISSEDIDSRCRNVETVSENNLVKTGLLAVPSFSTLQTLRKSIIESGNTFPLTQKHIVQLDWVSKEDGSHILTVAVGNKIMLLTSVSSDLAQANMKAMKESQSTNRPLLKKASSLAVPNFTEEIRWMKLRKIELRSADGLPPLPMQISWVRDGILVVAMDNEMHVYSQWKPDYLNHTKRRVTRYSSLKHQESEELNDTRNLRDEDLRNLATETSQRRLANVSSMPHLSRVSSINLTMLSAESKKNKIGGSTAGSNQVNTNNMESYMPDYGLFEASHIACPVLPQYHPKQLMELLNSGKIRWVKAILAHLVRCIAYKCRTRHNGVYAFPEDESVKKPRGWSKSRTLSVSYAGGAGSPLEHHSSTAAIPEEVTLDYAEITSIPPLPLWMLLVADKENNSTPSLSSIGANASTVTNQQEVYSSLFDGSPANQEDNLDDLLEDDDFDSAERLNRRHSSLTEKNALSHFGPRQGRVLSLLLTHTHLPGLSSLDQMHLLALADTVSTCNVDFADKFAIDATIASKSNVKNTSAAEGNISTDCLDDCGLRFLLAMKHYSYLLRCLPLAQRALFQKQGISTSKIVWAFHSESEEELLQMIPSYAKGVPKWSIMKELGVGWWLRSNSLLKICMEKIAKAAYMENEDPLDAAIFYLAMRKKSVVWGLFRSKRDERMTSFFANNFAEDRWRKAALKNAFALLGKQRFEHAAAFFLLAGALRDAIEVCLNKLHDLQLAMIIARLYEGEMDSTPPSLRVLLYEEVLGCNAQGGNQRYALAHPDPFLRSMALWMLKDLTGSLNTLLCANIGTLHPEHSDQDKQNHTTNPNVFNFYIYLRTHPLLIRHSLASHSKDQKKMIVLSGFSHSLDSRPWAADDYQLCLEDEITPLERQLYFATAHAHFKAGCPALALDVLSKLPSKIVSPSYKGKRCGESNVDKCDSQISTGIIKWDEDTPPKDTSDTCMPEKESPVDWSQPIIKVQNLGSLDDLLRQDEDGEANEKVKTTIPEKRSNQVEIENSEGKDSGTERLGLDIMAQQFKFVACLKILMEELSTLATGYEVDGGQLRYHLYLWLERQVESLRILCNYCSGSSEPEYSDCTPVEAGSLDPGEGISQLGTPNINDKPTLHEILIAEKLDFEAKVLRATRRKKWLKANETLLRTLLSYCSLHGASGGGLASVRMELVLLLQELQQEKIQQQLLSPLPFPTTLPLLSACVASNKTVVTDPVRFLQANARDILQCIVEMKCPPMFDRVNLCELFVLRDLAVALSSCIYQSLCDSDPCGVRKQYGDSVRNNVIGLENACFGVGALPRSHHLIASHKRHRYSSFESLQITTQPSKWPGVTNLRALLARERDDDTPRLNILLCEAFVASFMSFVTYALATCDCHILYRLAGQKFTEKTWATLFGGGVKRLLKIARTVSSQSVEKDVNVGDNNGVWTTVTSLTRQRVRLNLKILGSGNSYGSSCQAGGSIIKEDKPTYREHFVSPDMSMVSYFLSKPRLNEGAEDLDYDSADSAASEHSDDEDGHGTLSDDEDDVVSACSSDQVFESCSSSRRKNTEHSNPYSYAWLIMRLAILKNVHFQLEDFLAVAGIDSQELPVSSPLVHGIIRTVNRWEKLLREELEEKGPPPPNYIPGCHVDHDVPNVESPTKKYRCLLDMSNTPFHPRNSAAAPARRLWCFLVQQESVQDLFVKSIFGQQRITAAATITAAASPQPNANLSTNDSANRTDATREKAETEGCGAAAENGSTTSSANVPDAIRIIHKEQEAIECFCLNQVNGNLIAMATPREVQEIDISLLLELPSWLEDECEFDLVNATKEPETDVETKTTSNFLVVQSASVPSQASGLAGQTGRGASVVLKHKVECVKRISPHPLLPLYLTGAQDGSVQMWEWGHLQAVAEPRPAASFAKVTRVRFSQHGNKFGVADGDGNVSLWNVGLTSNHTIPFFTYQCHTKYTSDFVFLGSCSLIATAGNSPEFKNVAIWDSLLPQSKALVTAFPCHEQGASCLVFAPQHHLLISAGKRGDVFMFDLRQRTIRRRFSAHDASVRCIALDPHEEFFVTGSADGDVRVWSLASHRCMYTFLEEHTRSSFFKHMGQGVNQVYVDSAARLFSCGADGSMKVRHLPERDFVHKFY